jgi:xanthine dehydrogenase YagT iron-sulfur-binding subunit
MAIPDDRRQGIARRGFLISVSASALALRFGSKRGIAAVAGTTGRAPAPTMPTSLNVNGKLYELHLDPRVTLLDAVREHLHLTGTKKGCDQGTCGACTLLVNGSRILSCLTLAAMHHGERVTTIEGLAPAGKLHPIQAAFIERDALQCGYCTPGQIMSATALLNEKQPLDRETVAREMSGNICRCGCYPHIVDAVLVASRST